MARSREADVRPSPCSRPRVRDDGARNTRPSERRPQAAPYDWERDGEALSDEPRAQEPSPSPAGVQPQKPGEGRPARLPVWFGRLCVAMGWLLVGFVTSASAVLVIVWAILVLRGGHH